MNYVTPTPGTILDTALNRPEIRWRKLRTSIDNGCPYIHQGFRINEYEDINCLDVYWFGYRNRCVIRPNMMPKHDFDLPAWLEIA